MAQPEKALRSEDFTGNGLVLLADYLARRLTALRLENDKHVDPYATARIRGRIAEMKRLAVLVAPKEIPRAETATLGVEELDEHAERWLRTASVEQRAEALEE